MMSLEVHSAPELQIQELSGIIRAFLDHGGLIGLGCNTFSLPKSREIKDARFLMAFIQVQYFSKCCLFVDHTVDCRKEPS